MSDTRDLRSDLVWKSPSPRKFAIPRMFAYRLARIKTNRARAPDSRHQTNFNKGEHARGNREDILHHLPVPAHLFVTLTSLNETESLADARKSEISWRRPRRRWRRCFCSSCFWHTRKNPREAARPPSKRNVKYGVSYDSSTYSIHFSHVSTSVIKHVPIIICDKKRLDGTRAKYAV